MPKYLVAVVVDLEIIRIPGVNNYIISIQFSFTRIEVDPNSNIFRLLRFLLQHAPEASPLLPHGGVDVLLDEDELKLFTSVAFELFGLLDDSVSVLLGGDVYQDRAAPARDVPAHAQYFEIN